MTVRKVTELLCDSCDMEADALGQSADDARDRARRDGWLCVRRSDGLVDLCPACRHLDGEQ